MTKEQRRKSVLLSVKQEWDWVSKRRVFDLLSWANSSDGWESEFGNQDILFTLLFLAS